MTRHIAVYGATGFVGTEIMRMGQQRGHAMLPLSAPRLRTEARTRDAVLDQAPDAAYHLTKDLGKLRSVDVVINAAGLADPRSDATDELYGANALLPAALATIMLKVGVSRLVHISSAAVHGTARTLVESAEPMPVSPYGHAKHLGELAAACPGSPAGVVIYRPTSVHGSDRRLTRTLRTFASSPIATVAGAGTAQTPQVRVENVAAAAIYLATAAELPPGPTLHPWEGMSTASILTVLGGGREPRRVPEPIARGALRIAHVIGGVHPALRAHARRLDMLWFGQAQEPGWLDASDYQPVTNWSDTPWLPHASTEGS